MTFEKLVDGPLFDGQIPRQMFIQSNGHVWAITFPSTSFFGDTLNLYKSTDGGTTFEVNTAFNIDVLDAFIAEDIDGRLWRISFFDPTQQWLLERSDSGIGDDWTVIGSSPAADIFIYGPKSYYDNSLSGLVCHPTDSNILAFSGGSIFYDEDSYVYGACPVWVVTDGVTINQIILPMTDYDLSGLATNDVLFTQDGRLLVSYSYFQNTGSIRIVSVAYSDDYSSFTEIQLLPEYNIDDFGWYEHLYMDTDGVIYCIFGRDVPTAGEHCWQWFEGVCTANQIVYEHGFFVVKSMDGISWSLIWDMHVPESAESAFDAATPAPDYLYQTYVPGSNVAGIMHDGTLLHVWFQSWQGFPGPVDPGLSLYWTYDGSSWTEQTMFGPGGSNAFLVIGSISNRPRVTV